MKLASWSLILLVSLASASAAQAAPASSVLKKLCKIHNDRLDAEKAQTEREYRKFRSGEDKAPYLSEEYFQEAFAEIAAARGNVPVFMDNLHSDDMSVLDSLVVSLNCGTFKLAAKHIHTEISEEATTKKETPYTASFTFDPASEKAFLQIPGYLGGLKFDIQMAGGYAVLFTKQDYRNKMVSYFSLYNTAAEAEKAAADFRKELEDKKEPGSAKVLPGKKQPLFKVGAGLLTYGNRYTTVDGVSKSEPIQDGNYGYHRGSGWNTALFFTEKVSRTGVNYEMPERAEGVTEQLDYLEVLSALAQAK